MTDELTDFLLRNHACSEGLSRLAATGATTPEEAWIRADASDLIWAVTCPGVMSSDQRRRFLAEAVLAPIEHLLTDERSKNILQKLRTNEPITAADAAAARAAYAADADAAYAAADAAAYREVAAASLAAAEDAAYAAEEAASAAAYAADADAASLAAAEDAAYAAEEAASAAAYAAAREAQAKWIRDNFVLTDLNIN